MANVAVAGTNRTGLDVDAIPLCVDLDGTLLRTDMLAEGFAQLISKPAAGLRPLLAMSKGRAAVKGAVAAASDIDPASLPYNQALLTFLEDQKAQGRTLILVTAADVAVASRIAAHLGLFDEVIASDGVHNMKGNNKAEELVRQFGRGGFDYAGDSRADIPVFLAARNAILVNPSRSTLAAVQSRIPVAQVFRREGSAWRSMLRAMRPHQWCKNLLVFVPLFVSGVFPSARELLAALLCFGAFCLAASGIYLLNDLADLAADRAHPRKRSRPFASGDASIFHGLGLAIVCVAGGVVLASLAGVLPVIMIYIVTSSLYSWQLKELPLVDVFVLAALYSVRLFGGGVAVGHYVSLWLLMFSSFLFLSLALVKRAGELCAMQGRPGAQLSRRGYMPADTAILQMFGCSCAIAAVIVLALFIQNETNADRYSFPLALWGIVPLVLFWQFRMWLSTVRGYMHDDPIVYAARDWVSALTAVAAVLLVAVARVYSPG